MESTKCSIAESLQQQLDRLTAAERKLARILLSNYPMAGLETVAQFAERANVSGPTVLRFVNKLGYVSYLEFQQVLRDELNERLQSPILAQRKRVVDESDYITQMSEAISQNIHSTIADVSRATFDAVLTLLADSKRSVYVMGGRFGYAMAEFLRVRLHMLRKNVFLVSGQTSTWPETILDLSHKDVLVVFDARRYQANIQEFAEHAASRGAHIVLFTDQWLSPIANVAEHTFAMKVGVPSRWDTVVPTLTLIECLLTAMIDRHWQDARVRLEQLELLRGI